MQKGKLFIGMFLVLLMAGCSATGTSKNDEGTKETVKTSMVSTSEENSVNKGEKVSTFVWGKGKDEARITYTYDESKDVVTKFKIESPQYGSAFKNKEEGNKMCIRDRGQGLQYLKTRRKRMIVIKWLKK